MNGEPGRNGAYPPFADLSAFHSATSLLAWADPVRYRDAEFGPHEQHGAKELPSPTE